MDTNGNFFSADAHGNIIDTLGRTPITATTSGSTITYAVLSTSGTPTDITVTTTTISANTSFGQSGIAECTTCTMTAIQSIAFDDGSSYSFAYDSGTASGHFGELTSMTLRTGGTINYGYTTFADALGNHSRWLSSKAQGSNPPWTYTPAVLTSPSQKVTVKDCLGNSYVFTFVLNNGAWVNNESFIDATLGSLGTVSTTWDTSNSCPTNSNCSGAAFVRRLTSTIFLPNGLTKNTTYSYASTLTGQVNEIDESDYSTSTPPILKKTLINYASLGNILTNPHQVTIEDGSNNVISQTTYTYDQGTPTATGAPQHIAVTTPRGNVTTTSRLVAGTTTLTSIFTYDDTGNLLTNTDPAGNVTAFDYTDSFSDATGTGTFAYSTKTTFPPTSGISHITHTKYEFNTGLPVSTTDLNGNSTGYTYETELRPLSVSAPDGGQTSFSYPSANSVVKSHAITGTQTFSTTTNFDAYGRVSQELLTSQNPMDPDTVDTTYDNNGRVHSVSNPHRSGSNPTDGTTTFAYDALGRIIQTTEQDGNTVTASYASNCVTVTDETGRPVKTCNDGLGRTTSTFEPDDPHTLALNWETDTTYNPLGNIMSTTQKGEASSSQWRTRTFTYDGLSRVTQSITPEANTTNYFYTTTGGTLCSGSTTAPCRITDARGITTTLTYDALNRLTGKTYSDTTHSVSYVYDQASVGTLTISNPNGSRTSMSDGSGSTAWSYDKMGRIATRQQTISSVTKSINYTYNLDGSISTIAYPSGRTYTYTYNNADQISTLKDVSNSINFFSSPQYAPPGLLTSAVHGAVTGWNAITLTNTYNNRLQLSQAQAVSPLPSTLLNLSYSYVQTGGGNNGNVVSITNNRDPSRSVSYTYDQVNRLATAQTSSSSVWGDSYTYDAWGNLLQKNVTLGTAESMALMVNNKNQVTSPAFTYDAAGNLTWDTTHALNYDAEGHMTPVSGETYTYDGDGRRVLKSDGTVYWLDDQMHPLSVGTTSGSITRDYIFLGSQRIAMVPLSSGNPYYYLSDRLGSTAVIASGDGKTIQWEADYFPFGTIQQQLTNIVGNNYEFTGYENDSETGYNYANARFDAGRWGRFLTPDPYSGSADVTNPQSLNRYAYVLNNPANNIDPKGLVTIPQSWYMGFANMGCSADGIDTLCSMVNAMIGPQTFLGDGSTGGAVQCPDNDCGLGTSTPFQCVGSVCGYMSTQYVSTHENEYNGILYSNSEWQLFLSNRVKAQQQALADAIVAGNPRLTWEDVYGNLTYVSTKGGNANFKYTGNPLDLSFIPGYSPMGGCEVTCRIGGIPSIHAPGGGLLHLDSANPLWGFGLGALVHGLFDVMFGNINGDVPMGPW